TLVMLAQQDLSADDVLKELERRFGLSGLDEKASRTK
ncbi:MAG TPA: phosphoribosyl-ATP pyrophosphatase, partial [Cycloclasticus sp.]|nr:phosphoribosyl-ATP pyrophosphatase [Cycloclasticus sp.]